MIWKDEARFGGFLGFSRQEYWSGLPFPSPVDHIFVRTLHHNPSILDGPTWHPRTPWTVWKGKKIGHWKMNSPGQYMPNMLLEISGEITPEEWRDGAKAKKYPVVDGTGDRSKVWCCKEQYCIGTWNVRSTNQGKVEVVKQEMARMNIDTLDRKSVV